ncbi:glycosyltransferase family 2 protein [Algoriphagus aquatilis]|uniref:Glycosyltransferase family 2 protein n=1 Tax=Algoriphagus aquatilis TaxID=490186 RepID=A0ABW0BSB2_9BACT
MKSPFFSIVIPTFNSEKTLKQTLESIIAQKFEDYEILILDGGSTDGTLLVPNQFNQSRIFVFDGPDLGTYDAMNKGIRLAKGEWIYFLGSDDILYDEFVLEIVFKEIQATALPVVYGNVKILGDTGWARDGEIYAGYFSKNRMLKKSICHQAIFYKREFLAKNDLFFDLRYPVSADWHLNLRCRRLTKFTYVDQIIAVFASGGISSTKSDSFPEEIKVEFTDLLPSTAELYLIKISNRIKVSLRSFIKKLAF